MRWILKIIGATILFTLFAFALAWVTMLLWNWLVPGLFNGPVITYLEAAGLMILGRLLVGGFKGGRRKHCCGGNSCGHGHHHGGWKKRWEDKMSVMSEEDREKFRSGIKKCGWWEEGKSKDSSTPNQ